MFFKKVTGNMYFRLTGNPVFPHTKNATVLHKSAGKRRKWVHKQAATTRPDPAQQQ